MSRPRDIARILGKTEVANPDNKSLSANDGSTAGLVVYDSTGLLPSSGLTAGSQAYVTANNRLYISNGAGWFNRALINATPALSLSSSGTIALATDGTPTTITMTATDSDNSDANLVLSLESGGDLFKFATVSQDSSVVTITPRSSDSATALGFDGSATLTFRVSDGINQATVQNTFTLSFGPDWTGSYADQILDGDATNGSAFGASIGMSGDGNYAFISDQSGGGGTGQGRLFAYSKSGTTWSVHTSFGAADGSNQTHYGIGNQTASLNSDGTFGVFGLPAYNSNKGGLRVYKRTGATYGNAQTLTQTADNGAQLGTSVAMSNDGNYMIAGAPDAAGGKVHFFNLSNSSNNTWSTNGVFSRTTTDHSTLGQDVGIDATGVYAVAGAPSEGSSFPGYAYIYKRTGSTWALETTLTNPDNEANSRFGGGLAINHDGDVLYVGAYAKNVGSGNEGGKIHMYTRSGTTWTLRASFTSGTATNGEEAFGKKIACSADGVTMVTGVPYIPGGAGSNASAGYGGGIEIWTRDGNTMSNTKNIANNNLQSGGLSAGSAGAYDLFGLTLATNNNGDEIMAGSTSGQKTGSGGTTGVVAVIRPS